MGKFRKQTPGEGKKTAAVWSTVTVDGGEGINLWKVGPTLWFWSHFVNGRTIPCYHEFTGGEVKCPKCGTRDYWQGYTPCYDETGARLIALPKEANKPVDDRIKPGDPVYVSRKRGKQKPQTVMPKPWAKPWVLTDRDAEVLADLEPRLVMIWKDETIRDWYGRQGGEPVTLKAVIEKATESRDEADKDAKFLRDHVAKSLVFKPQVTNDGDPVSIGDALPGVNGRPRRR